MAENGELNNNGKNIDGHKCLRKITAYIRLMRPGHYIKNILVFVPVFSSLGFLDHHILARGILGIVIFCLLSSSIYAVNDVFDAEYDKNHEIKRNRPIASGMISKRMGIIFSMLLLMMATVMGGWLNQDCYCWTILGLYYFLNILYSRWLKQLPIIDVFLLVLFYLIRILYGCFLNDIPVSFWLCMTVMSFSFFMGFGKRRNELNCGGKVSGKDRVERVRKVLGLYTTDFLDKNMYVSMCMGIIFYALWTHDASTIHRLGTDKQMWTVPIVALICMRYSMDIEKDGYADPVDVIYRDRALILMGGLYVAMLVGIVYAGLM